MIGGGTIIGSRLLRCARFLVLLALRFGAAFLAADFFFLAFFFFFCGLISRATIFSRALRRDAMLFAIAFPSSRAHRLILLPAPRKMAAKGFMAARGKACEKSCQYSAVIAIIKAVHFPYWPQSAFV